MGINGLLKSYKDRADYYIGKLQDFLIRKDVAHDKNYYIIYSMIDYYFGDVDIDEALDDIKYAANKAE